MADKNIIKMERSRRRRRRVRGKVSGTAERPRLSVTKSLKNVSAQIINDEKMETLVGITSNSKAVKAGLNGGATKTEAAHKVGEVIAQLAKENGIENVVFDRNRCRFHGRIKAAADGAREGGLKF
ncbi:MAG: 50S ribosomal protein L18 [candidate division Zixibacteria bacterium]|nr:50S ribosomal protein L18 [candidate division Zixibacteria bacterium]